MSHRTLSILGGLGISALLVGCTAEETPKSPAGSPSASPSPAPASNPTPVADMKPSESTKADAPKPAETSKSADGSKSADAKPELTPPAGDSKDTPK